MELPRAPLTLLEKEMATLSNPMPGKFHRQRNSAGYSPWGCKESATTGHFSTSGPAPAVGTTDTPTPPPLVLLETQTVKNPPAMQENWVRSLGWKDPLEKGMATHSSVLAWRIL